MPYKMIEVMAKTVYYMYTLLYNSTPYFKISVTERFVYVKLKILKPYERD